MKAAAIRTVLTATFIFLMAPIVVVVVSSFNAVGVLSFPPQSFTTRWYYEIDPAYYQALTTSLIVATITVVIAVLVGVPAPKASITRILKGPGPGAEVTKWFQSGRRRSGTLDNCSDRRCRALALYLLGTHRTRLGQGSRIPLRYRHLAPLL
jgi:hypothetical protein